MQGGTHEQASSFHLGLTSEPPEELLDPMATWATWAVPYKQLSIDQQRAAWFMDGNSKVKGQHPVWKAATLKKVKTNQLHGLNCLFAPMSGFLLTHGKCSNGLVTWLGRWAMENWSIKGLPVWGMALWK